MAFIKSETAKYDRTMVEAALRNKLETTVHKISKKQKEQIVEEQRAMRRIDKLEDLLNDLVSCETKVSFQAERMANLKAQAVQSFADFDKAREENAADMTAQAQEKRNELDQLKE